MTTQKSWRRRTRLQILFLLVCFATAGAILYFFQESSLAEERVVAVFQRPDGTLTSDLNLELAVNDTQRERGLMYRKTMQAEDGMLFIFSASKHQRFWMKNTYIPLDMLFVDENKKVAGVLADVPPLNLDPREIPGESKYVVELLAGTAQKLNITKGAVLSPKSPIPQGK